MLLELLSSNSIVYSCAILWADHRFSDTNIKYKFEERKCFSALCISSSKVDRFTSNQDQNDHQPILHISCNTFQQWKCIFFCDICMSLCHIPHIFFVYSVLEHHRKLIFYGDLTAYTSEWWSNSKMKRHWEWKYKSHFSAYICQKWIDLHQTQTSMIFGLFYTHCQIHLTSENTSFFDIYF